jgi:predicted peptidase
MYKGPSGNAMPYRIFIPSKYDSKKAYPIIIWLHGSGGSGTDNISQLMGDQIAGTRIWTSLATQKNHPAFVLAPQVSRCWDPTGYHFGVCQVALPRGAELSPELLLVSGILETLEKEFSIDRKRVYIAGQSLGGIGTWNFVTKRPELFAAAIVLCGAGNSDLAARAKAVPIWSFQGDADTAPIVASNRAMIAALRKAGGKPRYTEYPGVGHAIWNRVF